MLQPVNLQLAHFNVEHSAQISKDALAAAQQTGQGQEIVQENVKRAQSVQASLAAAEPRKVKRREEDERERRREERKRAFSGRSEDEGKSEPDKEGPREQDRPGSGFEFYA
jgi:hypothetical protein